jgi:hypothetical protein
VRSPEQSHPAGRSEERNIDEAAKFRDEPKIHIAFWPIWTQRKERLLKALRQSVGIATSSMSREGRSRSMTISDAFFVVQPTRWASGDVSADTDILLCAAARVAIGQERAWCQEKCNKAEKYTSDNQFRPPENLKTGVTKRLRAPLT